MFIRQTMIMSGQEEACIRRWLTNLATKLDNLTNDNCTINSKTSKTHLCFNKSSCIILYHGTLIQGKSLMSQYISFHIL